MADSEEKMVVVTLPDGSKEQFDSGITGDFEEGKLTPQDFFFRVKEALDLRIDYQRFLPIWNEIFFLTQENLKVYQLAKNLKNKYKTALLSNVNVLHFSYLKDKFPIFDAFHHILTSFELGGRKPDPLIYRKATETLGVSSMQNVFYTDDRAELIEKAKELGIKGVVFENTAQLEDDLKNLGIDAQ